jgi:hypothetical protein
LAVRRCSSDAGPFAFVYHTQPEWSIFAATLTLSKALKSGHLQEFVAQEEARVGPISKRKLDAAIKKLAATQQQSEDRTSRSSSDDGSTEK